MKQLFIGLLIIAAGAGVYYFLQKKKSEIQSIPEKDLLIGTWKIDSAYVFSNDSASKAIAGLLLVNDSSFRRSRLDFRKGGTIFQTRDASPKVDTSYYEWSRENELIIKESIKDSLPEIYSVNKLNNESLVLQSKDSTVFVLSKLK